MPEYKQIVLVGGGHAHAVVLKIWAEQRRNFADQGLEVHVVSDSHRTSYSGMLTGYIAGSYSASEMSFDVQRLAERAGARFHLGRVSGIDLKKKFIKLSSTETLRYDVASLNIGAVSDVTRIPGGEDGIVPVKPIVPFVKKLESLNLQREVPSRIVIIGGGAAGVEVACAIAARWRRQKQRIELTLIESEPRLLSRYPSRFSQIFERVLKKHHVGLLTSAVVTRTESVGDTKRVHFRTSDGKEKSLEADLVLLASGVVPEEWVRRSGLRLADDFLEVDTFLMTSDPAVFAAGDVVHVTGFSRPPAGVFAIRAAPALATNLIDSALGKPLVREFKPQNAWLSLLIDGFGGAAATRGRWSLPQSAFLWWLKDRIDRGFVESLS